MLDVTDLWRYPLRRGASDHPRNGACLFDAGMWLVYGRIGDNPPCSCPVIRAYAIGLNDRMDDTARQLLRPYILRVVGNRDPEAEPARLHRIVLDTARKVVPLASALPEFQALRLLPDDASYETIRAAARAVSAYAAADWAAAAEDIAAAYTAAGAAGAAEAAEAAAAAARAVAHAADAADAAVQVLDAALRIGKQSPEYDETEVRAAVTRFAAAALET